MRESQAQMKCLRNQAEIMKENKNFLIFPRFYVYLSTKLATKRKMTKYDNFGVILDR